MSLHKLSAGSGYDYLTRQVAALDSTEKGHTSLASYYSEKGESPGHWLGAGLAGLDGLAAGDAVTAAQMKHLFGAGRHPLSEEISITIREDSAAADLSPRQVERMVQSATRLGVPFPVARADVSGFQVEVARRVRAGSRDAGLRRSASVGDDAVAAVRSAVGREWFAREYGRAPEVRELAGFVAAMSRPATSAVAGFDLTFSPVKSVSALWALAPTPVRAQIELAHRDAVADALAFIEREALRTRLGASGARQVETRGLVAAAFTHRDSRAGDPDLHTHVAVANKVQAPDGRWLAIDGRELYKAITAASETYNTAVERHVVDRLGVVFAPRADTDPTKRPIREIVGVDPRLISAWSSRRQSITARTGELSADFQAAHGRPPTRIESLRLAQQATLETRDAKHEPRSLAEQTAAWRAEAAGVLGGSRPVDQLVATALHPPRVARFEVTDAWIDRTASDAVGTVERSRATWQYWHVRAEASRAARTAGVPARQLDAVVEAITARALAGSLRLTPVNDGVSDPRVLRRSNGESMYARTRTALYTSERMLAAEERIVTAAGRHDGRRVPDETVAVALLEAEANGPRLNPGQVDLVTRMATSAARVQLAIAPAGSGKTTAMRALTQAWTLAGGTVIGLAPSAAAASQLADQIDAPTDTLAKLVHHLTHADQPGPEWLAHIDQATLVIIDEAGLADTPSLDTAISHVLSQGGSVRLVGDDQQLAAVGAGGVLRDIANRHGACHLTDLVRFARHDEAAATLALRAGRSEALGFYLDNGRVHVGDQTLLTDQLFGAWTHDTTAGTDALMLASTRQLVTELNERARQHRLAGTSPGRTVGLADGTTASAGDVVITRRNNRRLRTGPTDWVKNGDRWTITQVHHDGALTVQHLRHHRQVVLPVGYVADHVELGYATTIHAAQGVTADHTHGLLTGTETRQQLYTMATRGRHANHLYLVTTTDGDPHTLTQPDTIQPPTPTDLLERILAHDDHATSATSSHTLETSPAHHLAAAVAAYTDALSVACEHVLPATLLDSLDATSEQALPGLTGCPSWPGLHRQLLLHAADGNHPRSTLAAALDHSPLDHARDPAAVLAWRLDHHPTGPLPWLPAVPTLASHHPQWGPYLRQRHDLVSRLADQVRDATPATPAWLDPGTHASPTALADIAVWRAAHGVLDTDQRPLGPREPGGTARVWQTRYELALTRSHHHALAEWGPLLTSQSPTLTHDPQLPTLARRLARLAATGAPALDLVQSALAERPLPDDHPAAALWWRLHQHIPATLDHLETPLPPLAWDHHLDATIGSAAARQLRQDPLWPALATTIDNATHRGWTLDTLLTGRDTADPQALTWALSILTTTHHPDEDRDGGVHDDEDPHRPLPTHPIDMTTTPPDNWHLTEPTDPDTAGPAPADPGGSGSTQDDDAAVRVEIVEPNPAQLLALDAMLQEGMPLPEPDPQLLRTWHDRANAWTASPHTEAELIQLNELAARFYQSHYPGSWSHDYLSARLHTDLADHPVWRPGHAPAGWTTLTDHLRRAGHTDDAILASGLARTARTGRLIDHFRDRLVLPITTPDGTITGFIARRHPHHTDHDHAGPKYLNTPETLLFHKANTLYANHAALTDGAHSVLVEGALDAIAIDLATRGTHTGIAPLGTHLTWEHAQQLQHLGRDLVIATDNDPAGQAAAHRDYWTLAPWNITTHHAQLPPDSDPADLLEAKQQALLINALTQTRPLGHHLLDGHLQDAVADPTQAATHVTHAITTLAAMPPTHWEPGVAHLSRHAHLDAETIKVALHNQILRLTAERPSMTAWIAPAPSTRIRTTGRTTPDDNANLPDPEHAIQRSIATEPVASRSAFTQRRVLSRQSRAGKARPDSAPRR